jgi:fucose permease
LNLLHTVFGVGALIGPIFSRLMLLGSGRWEQAYVALSLICAVVLLAFLAIQRCVYGVTPATPQGAADAETDPDSGREAETPDRAHAQGGSHTPARADSRSEHRESPLRLLRHPRMWLVSGIMFLYVGHQSGASVWLPTFMQETLGSSIGFASATASLLWVGIVLGRIVVTGLSRHVDARRIMWIGTLCAGAIFGAAYLIAVPAVLAVACLVTGFLSGAVIPLVVAVACGWVPEYSGSASALVFLNASLSRMLFPWLIGVIAEAVSFPAGMSLTWVTLILAGLLALLIPTKTMT